MKKAKFWFKNEKEVMKALGFEPVKGSGSGWIHKEDGESEIALAQLKSTEAESYRINYLDIQKLEYHAAVAHKIPVFVVEFLNRGTYFLINTNDLEDLDCLIRGGKNECRSGSSYYIDDSSDVNISSYSNKMKVGSSKSEREKFYKEREKQWSKKKRKK